MCVRVRGVLYYLFTALQCLTQRAVQGFGLAIPHKARLYGACGFSAKRVIASTKVIRVCF